MISRSNERINLKIEIQYLINSYKIITVLQNLIYFHLLASNKKIKLYIDIVKYLKKSQYSHILTKKFLIINLNTIY